MRLKPEWDVEITFDPTYAGRPGDAYVARCYPHGSRRMAYMVETAPTGEEALEQMRKRIAEYVAAYRPEPDLVTVSISALGEVIA